MPIQTESPNNDDCLGDATHRLGNRPIVQWGWYRLRDSQGGSYRIWGFEKDYGWRGALTLGGLMVTYLRGMHTEKKENETG
jgi:hypothetical protein